MFTLRILRAILPFPAVLFIAILPGTVWSQADTVPVALQSKITARKITGGNSAIFQFEYNPSGTILASPTSTAYLANGTLFSSTDGGVTFNTYDLASGYPGYNGYFPYYYCLAHETQAVYRFIIPPNDTSGEEELKFQISHDLGKTWAIPEGTENILFTRHELNIGLDPAGDRISAFNIGDNHADTGIIYLATEFGSSSWQAIPLDSENTTIPGYDAMTWANDNYGLLYHGNPSSLSENGGYLSLTIDGGYHWRIFVDSILNSTTLAGDCLLYYPFPGIIIVQGDGIAISRDTGKTWQRDDTLPGISTLEQMIDFVLPNRWIATMYVNDTQVPAISVDSGRTWVRASYYDKYWYGGLISFKDSLNGLECNGWDIIAKTSDGGNTWHTIDSSDYMFGHITPAVGLDSAYYSFHPFYDTVNGPNGAYAFITRNRGATWQQLFANVDGYAFAGLDSEVWVGGTGFARIAWYTGGGTTFLISNRDSTRITAIDKNFVWVSDANQLYPAQNTVGNVTWNGDVAHNIPGYNSSDSYRFLPIDRNVVYVRAPDTVYVTKEGGINWSIAPAMPDVALDANHWFVFTSDTTSLNYTTDGGQNFTTVSIPNANARTILPIDSMRWYVNGFSTTDAGKSWQPIPGWDNKLDLYPVDATTAFGEPFANTANTGQVQILWRLDLPFTTLPKAGVAEQVQQPTTELIVFPNPATNTIQVTSATGEISILDPLGRIYKLPRTGNTLDISSLPSGVYFVSDGLSRAKFVKE